MQWIFVAFIGVLLLLSGPAPARMYKWVDDDGNVHYSDSLSSIEAQTRRDREVKSDSGVTLDRIEAPPTPEEFAAIQRERAAEAEAERKRAEQARRDRNLLLTFQSVSELEQARDTRLETLDSRADLIRQRALSLQREREQALRRAAALERSGDGDIEAAYDRIDELDRRLAQNRRSSADKEAEKERIRASFERDIERFRELTRDHGHR